jgi:protein TonB
VSVALEYRLDPQGWGVRVIQDSAALMSVPSPFPPVRGELPANLGVPVRVGGDVAPPKKIKDMPPVYPQAARDANVQGVVILEIVIDGSGNVVDTKVLRSIPLLDQAAIDAVMQWQYTPSLLNGVPTPVVMTVTTNFTLRSDPTVTLKIVSPTGRTGMIRMMDQAGVGIFDVPDLGKFGFTPIRSSSPTGRSIQIYEVGEPNSPLKLLGNVQVELNGGTVKSLTTPSFGVELVGIP